jgi:hypothetical protein
VRRSLLLAGSAAAVLTLGVAGTAGADTTALTLTLGAGSLVLDAPATASATGTIGAVSSVTVPVTGTTITDARGSLAGWTATATATDLSDGAGHTIDSGTMTWATTAVTPQSGQAAITLPAAGLLDPGAVMAVGAPLLSGGAFTVDGTITVPLAALTYAGTYTGTLTTTAV